MVEMGEDTDDPEAPCNWVYDHRLFCGGHECRADWCQHGLEREGCLVCNPVHCQHGVALDWNWRGCPTCDLIYGHRECPPSGEYVTLEIGRAHV
jgi:hypothetical protein